ncbi:MAG: LURP-one-related family protein [Clostridia bacterium]|nr:LURP-one-related family protein [Clostridia bacterium]
MKLLFKQKLFSWFDSYDIFDETGNTVYTVKGQLAWGHCFRVYDKSGREVGMVKEKVLTFLPKYDIYLEGEYAGQIKKQFTFFRPKFTIDYKGWQVDGSFFEWDYTVLDIMGLPVARVSKELFNWTDTYSIDVEYEDNALAVLMLVLAIDAEKCSRENG